METHEFDDISSAMDFLETVFDFEIAENVSKASQGEKIYDEKYNIITWNNGSRRFGRETIEINITWASERNLAG